MRRWLPDWANRGFIMKKSNVIVFVLLALASAFFLWLWYFLGLNRVDEPLDLVCPSCGGWSSWWPSPSS